MSGSEVLNHEYVILVSSDKQEFFVDKEIANMSEVLRDKLIIGKTEGKYRKAELNNIKGDTLEVVIQYLHFKSQYIKTDFEHHPKFGNGKVKFNVKPELALDVLKAAIFLKI
jgi:Skp1 family, tetramerisation domain.